MEDTLSMTNSDIDLIGVDANYHDEGESTYHSFPPPPNSIPRLSEIDRSNLPKNIIAITGVGGWSHLRRMLDVSQILSTRGFNITLLSPGNYLPSPNYPNISQISTGPAFSPSDYPGYDRLIEEFVTLKEIYQLQQSANKYYPRLYKIYQQAIEEFNPGLILCDGTFNFACFDAAYKSNIPTVSIASSFLGIVTSPYISDPMIECKTYMENESFWNRFKCEILKPLSLFYALNSYSNELNQYRAQVGVEPTFNPMERNKKSLFLVDTFYGFEVPQSSSPLYLDVGPILPDYIQSLSPELENFLSEHSRTIFVTFGTFFYTTKENNDILLKALIEAIDKKKIDGIIWSLGRTPKEKLPSFDLLNPTMAKHFHIANHVPQMALLAHENIKVILSHVGRNSCHELLYYGVPVLSFPLAYDQYGNAERLEALNVGLTLNKLSLNVPEIIEKLDILLNDKKIEKSCKRAKTLARINSKRKYRAADLIEYMIHANALDDRDEDDNDIDGLMREWITPDTRMGFFKGKYYDVYGAFFTILLSLLGLLSWISLKVLKTLFNFVINKFTTRNNKPKFTKKKFKKK
ncbi:15909_t:CDS:2 [Entrophospora sp. SA101]|nr:15909_t:CDS:2 [Entrophospora sp. SA101]CAJ0853451.1 1608_t:CDS:2 [Entrophospora sp. SA101]